MRNEPSVLIFEDEKMVERLIRLLFETAGLQPVRSFTGLSEFLAVTESLVYSNVCMVVCDYDLAGSTATEVIQHLINHCFTPQELATIHFIVSSGSGNPEEIAQINQWLREKGSKLTFLPKPGFVPPLSGIIESMRR